MSEMENLKPQSFTTALSEAEETCFNVLCSTLGLIQGRNAFIGTSSGVADCMVFNIGRVSEGQMVFFRSSSYCFEGYADFYSRDRKALQGIMMRILERSPNRFNGDICPPEMLAENSNVVVFRLTGDDGCLSEIKTSNVKLSNGLEVPVHTFTASFHIVFSVGKRGVNNTDRSN